MLGEAHGHFRLADSPRLLAGRRTRAEVIGALHAYARAGTGYAPGAA